MKKIIVLFVFFLFTLTFVACNKDECPVCHECECVCAAGCTLCSPGECTCPK